MRTKFGYLLVCHEYTATAYLCHIVVVCARVLALCVVRAKVQWKASSIASQTCHGCFCGRGGRASPNPNTEQNVQLCSTSSLRRRTSAIALLRPESWPTWRMDTDGAGYDDRDVELEAGLRGKSNVPPAFLR
ncbi:hypothetical protein C8Q80DRAFT_336095 [Daedaleopsis nitida]|nr:hypothetical protein C8Q80DRAFT_336095 [Daedaleopsis nitida]